ncbi:hypothetical protein SAMD00019534_028350, partial [Acytostelium subglobosum LB1]|uniref:hypothetical protein n=1 Tax=Acytostelium subglobosum LB1 TaxID=1410327 RepID=UPI000644F0AD
YTYLDKYIYILKYTMKIEGKTFLVTGGASGLGEATVRELVRRKANVVILDMNQELGDALVKQLGSDKTIYANADVSSEESVNNAIKLALNKFNKIHGAINCAGIALSVKTVSSQGVHPLDVFNKVLHVNLSGTFNVMRLCANVINKQDKVEGEEKGVFVNVSSVAAYDGQQGQAAYSASKAGVAGMTLPLAREFAQLGIRIMAVAPGVFDTPMFAMLPEPAVKKIVATVPYPNRLGHVNEFANLVAHIIENQYLNGEVIRLDGALRLPKL